MKPNWEAVAIFLWYAGMVAAVVAWWIVRVE